MQSYDLCVDYLSNCGVMRPMHLTILGCKSQVSSKAASVPGLARRAAAILICFLKFRAVFCVLHVVFGGIADGRALQRTAQKWSSAWNPAAVSGRGASPGGKSTSSYRQTVSKALSNSFGVMPASRSSSTFGSPAAFDAVRKSRHDCSRSGASSVSSSSVNPGDTPVVSSIHGLWHASI